MPFILTVGVVQTILQPVLTTSVLMVPGPLLVVAQVILEEQVLKELPPVRIAVVVIVVLNVRAGLVVDLLAPIAMALVSLVINVLPAPFLNNAVRPVMVKPVEPKFVSVLPLNKLVTLLVKLNVVTVFVKVTRLMVPVLQTVKLQPQPQLKLPVALALVVTPVLILPVSVKTMVLASLIRMFLVSVSSTVISTIKLFVVGFLLPDVFQMGVKKIILTVVLENPTL